MENKILSLEIDHTSCPIEIRERVEVDKDLIYSHLLHFKENYKLEEVFMLSTCNRMNLTVYGDVKDPIELFEGHVPPEYISTYRGKDAIEHLFSIASGLESQVIGEYEILGQLKEAFQIAEDTGTLGKILRELLIRAIRTGKRVRRETGISNGNISFASIVYSLIHSKYGSKKELKIFIVGTGIIARNLIMILKKHGYTKIFVTSPSSHRRTTEFSTQMAVEPVEFDFLRQADVIITATERQVIYPDTVKELKRPLTIIDLGFPRNVSPEIKNFKNIEVFDLDDLKEMRFQELTRRGGEIPKARKIITEEAEKFIEWLRVLTVTPVIKKIHEQAEMARLRELEILLASGHQIDKNLLERFSSRLVKKVLHSSVKEIKGLVKNNGKNHHHVKKIVVGTRGSKLALIQTNQVIDILKNKFPFVKFEVKIVKTTGDRGKIGVVGAFVKELELALLRGEIDIAIHSLKDMPTSLPDGLGIVSVPLREDIRDAFVSRSGKGLMEMPSGSVVGTGSPRRISQVLKLRPDLQVKPIKGNVDTRLRKLESGEYDAIILAYAGLKRLGLENVVTEIFEPSFFYPAVAQGAIGIEVRLDDMEIIDMMKEINMDAHFYATLAERVFLNRIGAGCRTPVGAFTTFYGSTIEVNAAIFSPDGTLYLTANLKGELKRSRVLGLELAETLIDQGAVELVDMSTSMGEKKIG